MTDHKGPPVQGYMPQSEERVRLVNENKVLEERVLRQIEQVQSLMSGVDQRWAAIAKTHIEQGFMALNRAVFRPQRIDLPEDK